MKKRAYAKVNLILRVLSKLPNGYHNLSMLNTKINLYDEIVFEEIEEDNESINIKYIYNEKIIKEIINLEDDLIYKIAKIIKERYLLNKGFNFTVYKNIPIGSGLGGGSSDASCVINILNEYYNLHLSYNEKKIFAHMVGTDTIYCLENNIALVEGLGEIVKKIDYNFDFLDDYKILIINDKKHMSTKDIYKLVDTYSKPIDIVELKKDFFNSLGNDLEKISIKNDPQIETIINYLKNKGVKHVQTTGSGPTVFAICENNQIEEIYNYIKNKEPNYYINYTNIYKE